MCYFRLCLLFVFLTFASACDEEARRGPTTVRPIDCGPDFGLRPDGCV